MNLLSLGKTFSSTEEIKIFNFGGNKKLIFFLRV